MRKIAFSFVPPLAVATALLVACAPLIADYSLQSYTSATTLKADVAALVSKSSDDYSIHASDVNSVILKMEEAREFSAGQAYNTLSTREWDLILDPNGHLAGGYFARWKSDGRLAPAEAKDKTTQINRAFDYLICLEANKQKATTCSMAEGS